MKKEKSVWVITIMTFWLWAPKQIQAQTDSLSTTSLREVVVTATKFSKPVTETGKVVTVIDEKTIAQSRGKDLAQLLNEQAGLIVAGANSNPGKDKSVYLRGAAGKYTLILVDGIPVNDPSGVDGAFDIRLISPDQVERIEILKGSQSTLYGTDAMAGVINIITKKNAGKSAAPYGNFSFGSFNTLRVNAGVAGKIKRADYHAGFTRLSSDGLSEAKDTTGNAYDKDGMLQQAVHLGAGYELLSNLKLRAHLRYTEFNGDYDLGAFADDPSATYTATFIAPGVQAEWCNKRTQASLYYNYNRTRRNYTDMYGNYAYDGRFHHAEAFVVDNPVEWFQILAGATWQQFDMVVEPDGQPSFTIFNPYASLFIRNVKGFSTEIGGRLVNHSQFGTAAVYSINPSWMINRVFRVFANLTSGFKTPVPNQLYGPFGANPNLKPEYARTAEAGLHWLPGQQLPELRITAFARNIRDAIVYTTAYENRDKLHDRGVEVEAFWKTGSISLQGHYQFVTGKEITPAETRDNPLYRRPHHLGGVQMSWKVTENCLVSLNVKSFGKRNDVYFDMNTFTMRDVVLEPYTLLDVYSEYRLGRINLFVQLRNALNNRNYYEIYGYNVQPVNLTGGIRFGG